MPTTRSLTHALASKNRARFEDKALYDENRRMHKEWKDGLEKVCEAFFSSDIVEVFTPRDIVITDVIRQVIEVVVGRVQSIRLKRASRWIS